MKGAKKIGSTYHRAPNLLKDAEAVAATDSGTLRLIHCQGAYFVERQEFDMLGRVRWTEATSRDVAEWLGTFLSELRGDE